MSGGVPDPLVEWARGEGPARVLAAARVKREAGKLGVRSRLAIALTPAERAQVGVLLGTRWQAAGGPVTTVDLRRALGAYDVSVDELLVAVGGPLRDLPADRAAAAERRADEDEQARAVLAGVLAAVSRDDDWHAALLDSAVRACLPPAGDGAALSRAHDLARIGTEFATDDGSAPGDPPTPTQLLGVVAARLFTDAHALDRDRALGRAAARWAAHVAAAVTGGDPVEPLASARAWREAWEAVGVACDAVSSTVLVLALPLVGPSPAASLSAAAASEPLWLTLRSMRPPPSPSPGVREVFVCENPAVVEAAADQLGQSSAPLVCTFGVPGLAATTLLDALARAGVTLRIGADGDVTGRRIVNSLIATMPGAIPWRMESSAYEEEILADLLGDLASRPGS